MLFDELERFQHILTTCIHPELWMKGHGACFVVTYLLLLKAVVTAVKRYLKYSFETEWMPGTKLYEISLWMKNSYQNRYSQLVPVKMRKLCTASTAASTAGWLRNVDTLNTFVKHKESR